MKCTGKIEAKSHFAPPKTFVPMTELFTFFWYFIMKQKHENP